MTKPNKRARPAEHPLQHDVLRYIERYKANPDHDGNSPTYREIADGVGRTVRVVYVACQKLHQQGFIEISPRGKIVLHGGKYLVPDE